MRAESADGYQTTLVALEQFFSQLAISEAEEANICKISLQRSSRIYCPQFFFLIRETSGNCAEGEINLSNPTFCHQFPKGGPGVRSCFADLSGGRVGNNSGKSRKNFLKYGGRFFVPWEDETRKKGH